jgi:hypothetical protein
MNDGVKGSLITMREMAAEGYDARQIGLKMIIPRVGRKLSAKKRKLSPSEKAKQNLLKAMMRKKAKAKAKAKASPENSAEIEAPWKDKFEQKNWRVTREFEGGQKEYGHEGLCVRAEQADGNSYRLTLMSSDEKGRNFMEIVLAEHCDEVDKMMRKPAQLSHTGPHGHIPSGLPQTHGSLSNSCSQIYPSMVPQYQHCSQGRPWP